MNARSILQLSVLAGLIAVAGCARKEPADAKNNSAGPKPATGLVGKWKLAKAGDKPIDWTFLASGLKDGKNLRFKRDGAMTMSADWVTIGGKGGGGFGSGKYEVRDGAVEITPDPVVEGRVIGTDKPEPKEKPKAEPRTLKFTVSADELVLTDDKGNAQTFKRVPAEPANVKVTGLPFCCPDCALELEKVLKKTPNFFDVVVDAESKSATFRIEEKDDFLDSLKVLKSAGMCGAVSVDGGQLRPFKTVSDGSIRSGKFKGIHACCDACEANITRLLEGSKVSFAGDGPTKTVTVIGAAGFDLIKAAHKLKDAGYDFYVEAEKK